MKNFFTLLLTVIVNIALSQNQANNWYFARYCGLNFNTGVPQVVHDSQMYTIFGCATISDSLGNLLFYTGEGDVYNKNHEIMPNGSDMIHPGIFGRAIINCPGTNDIYYVFTARHPQINLGLYYSIVDMTLAGGHGAVTEKDIPVSFGSDAAGRIALARKENSDAVWLITRKFDEDAIAAYLVDETGFHPNPVLSTMPDRQANLVNWGFLKITYDKKYLFLSYHSDDEIEICGFDASTGNATYMYTLQQPGGVPLTLTGIEFSPDSKYLYMGANILSDTSGIYQFDMQYIADQTAFNNSVIFIGYGPAHGLQLARDGKIYCARENFNFSGVISNPWVSGQGCEYQPTAINMFPGKGSYSLPNILLDYLYRFEWEGDRCQGSPVHFIPNFIPTPSSIQWTFEPFLPGGVSTDLSPTYAFQNPGIHEVQVDVWYPSGRFEHTSREIEIFPTPQPDLGTDTVVCPGSSVTLNANCTADLYSWSTGQIGVSQITVSDSGTYWVRATILETGCQGHDTIHVGFFPDIGLDTLSVIITPTTCGGNSGSITGITVQGSGPFTYLWQDLGGNPFGIGPDVFNLPAGQYFLTITDANGCESATATYTINDAGSLEVTQVQAMQPHCFRSDGELVVTAYTPSGSTLEYSIDDGVTYQAENTFGGLYAGSYNVRIRDENNCEGFYDPNPVVLTDIPGPLVSQTTVTNETDGQQNGSIEISATGSTPVLFYSSDNGSTWQLDGTFTGLSAGTYLCVVKDENDCDTSFCSRL